MATPYRDRIQAYCEAREISIPDGFFRHSASRYAVIDFDKQPPQLVALTWFKKTDLLHYLRKTDKQRMRILDFYDNVELTFQTGKLAKGSAIEDMTSGPA